MEAVAAMVWKGNRVRGAGWLVILAGLSGAGSSAGAQQPVSARLATSVGGELQSLATRASVAFAGQVVSIARRGGVVEIAIRVEQSVLGSPAGTYRLREWAGLWPEGQFRYTVGERALFLLHAAGGAGLSSPVNGAEGVIPLVVQGVNAPPLLDIRRVAASVLRSPGAPLIPEGQGAIDLAEAVTLIRTAAEGANLSGGRLHEPVRYRLPLPVLPAASPVPGTSAGISIPAGVPGRVGNKRRVEEFHASR